MRNATTVDKSRGAAGFSIASFAAGLAVGASFAVAALFFLGPAPADPSPASLPEELDSGAVEAPDFEFWQRLPDASVAPDTAPYQDGNPIAEAPEETLEYLVQAGAFKRQGAAERRRAELLLVGMPAVMSTVSINDDVMFRVLVGPYQSWAETQTAMRQLQDRNIVPVLLEKPPPTG